MVLVLLGALLLVLPVVAFALTGSTDLATQRQLSEQALLELSQQVEDGAALPAAATQQAPPAPATEDVAPTPALPNGLTDDQGQRLAAGVAPEFLAAQEAAGLVADAPAVSPATSGPGSLSGRVTDPEGQPVESACVSVWTYDGMDEDADATDCTAADGTYSISDLSLDTYYVEVLDAVHLHQAAYDEVVVDGAVTGADFQLLPGGAVAGDVTGTDGAPLEGICVMAYAQGADDYASARGCTDSAGHFQTSGLPAGTYHLDYWDANDGGRFIGLQADAVAVVVGQVTTAGTVELVSGGRVVGAVTDADSGVPVEGMCIGVSAVGDNAGATGCTDETGRYVTTGLDAGEYTVTWYSNGRYLRPVVTENVTVTLGEDVILDVTAELGASISGRVTAQDTGDGLQGVTVSASPVSPGPGSPAGGTARTAPDGSYEIVGLAHAPGTAFRVDFRPSADTPYLQQWYAGASSYQTAASVTVESVAGASGIDAALTRGATISGTVTSAGGSPLEGVSVSVTAQGSSNIPAGWTTTGAAGRYTTPGLPAGSYVVRFTDSAHGSMEQFWNGADTVQAATPVVLTAGSDRTGIDAALREGLTISGTVTRPSGSAGWVRVEAKVAGSTSPVPAASTQAGPDGAYTLRGLAPGSYVVSFTDGSYPSVLRPQWYDGADSAAQADRVVLTDAPVTGIDADLREGASVAGTITDAEGRPLPGACAELYRAESTAMSVNQACADGSGVYRLRGVAAGNYLIEFSHASGGYAARWYGGSATVEEAAVLSVVDGVATEDVDVHLDLGGRITGTLTWAGGGYPCVRVFPVGAPYGQPVSVTCRSTTATTSPWASDPLPSGEYLVQYSASSAGGGYVYRYFDDATSVSDATPVEVTAPQDTTAVDGVLPSAVTVTGRLTDATTSAPLTEGCVTATPATMSGSGYGYTCSLANGSWTLALEPGEYTLGFTSPGHRPQWWNAATELTAATPVTISAGTPAGPFDAALLGGAATVTGHLVDAATQQPVEGVCVRLSSAMSVQDCTDATGAYSLSLTPDSYWSSEGWSPLRVEDPDDVYAARYLPLPTDENGTTVLTDGQTLAGVDAEVRVGGRLTGTVTADNNGTGLSQVCLYLQPSTAAPFSTCSSPDGTFRTSALQPGDYTVQFLNQGGRYAGEYFDDAVSADDATTVTVTSGQATSVDAGLSLGGGLSGRLTLPDGAPATGACVSLTPLDPANGDPLTSCADSTGRWTSPGLRAGDWVVGAAAQGWASTWYPQAGSADDAEPVAVTAGNTTTGIDIQLAKPQPRINGTVTDAQGEPVAGVCAYLYRGWGVNTGLAWCTGADGQYSFLVDADEQYTVAVFDPQARFRTTWYGDVTDGQQAVPIQASGDGTPATADITVAVPTVVTASFERNGLPVSGICGYLYPASDAQAGAVAGACSGPDGRVSFHDVVDGDYVLGASDSRGRYATVWSGNAAGRDDAQVLAVGDTAELALDPLTLAPAAPDRGLLTGRITDAATGLPVEGVCGYVLTTGLTPAGSATCSVADGSYAVEVPTGSYRMVFSDPQARFETQTLGDTFAVTEGEATEAPVVMAPVRRIEGRIVDRDGTPLSGVCVYAYDGGGATAGAFCTGADGRWSISGLPVGDYRIGALDTTGTHQTVWRGGTSLADATPVALSNGTPVGAVGDLVATGLGAAEGVVVDAQGAPMAGVCVYVNRADGTYAGVGTCTGADGRYWLGPLPEGEYVIAYYPPGTSAPTPYWYDGASSEQAAERIAVTTGQTTDLNDQSF
ncbi:carboxypeptidase regulatory-like domain-containing protein [Geodermatophilus sp. CPCC 205506]|uniref:carboxypeptidase regulatory-like domain-containing protein n=1 Tax=Geodermatophilus sp. CPCC 205506 TaxID=2936596 RepID=UPI003EE8EE9E